MTDDEREVVGRHVARLRASAGLPGPTSMQRDLSSLLVVALRASGGSGRHAEAAREVVLLVIVAQLLAAAQHDGPPYTRQRAPRQLHVRRSRRTRVESLSGRRPRG